MTEPKAIVIKKNNETQTSQEIKKQEQNAQQKLSVAEMIAKAKQKASETKNSFNENRAIGLLPIGTRVFHASFGIGKILEIKDNSYIIDFTRAGKKTLDSTTSGLKTF